jgi:general secretion pathway protein D
MPFPSVRRSLAALTLVVASVIATAAPSLAAATLLSVRADPSPRGGAMLTLQFAGPAGKFRVLGVGTTEASVIFEQTNPGPAIAPTIAGVPPIASVSVVQTGTSTSVSLHLTSAAPVNVRQAGPSTIIIDVLNNGPQQNLRQPQAETPTSAAPGTITEVVQLKYADISEVAGLLVSGANVASNDIFQPQPSALGSNSLGGTFGGTFGQSGGGGFQPVQNVQTFGGFGQNQGVAQRLNETVAVDRRLNAVILTATPDIIAQYKALIDKVDIPVTSVILETEIVELDDNASRSAGIDFSANNATLATTSYTIKNLQTGQGELDLAANVYAQVVKGNGRIIAKPRILAQSGQSASILTGDAIPVITQVVVTGSSALTSQQVNYVNVGVSLQIQPRVSSDGYVTSHIYSEVSSVTGFTQGAPQISQRQANTTATVRDGESFVIGGLLQDNEIKSLAKIPFIGDLPLIGTFFRYYTSSHSQTNLYIVVTPHVVHRAEAPAMQATPQLIKTPLNNPGTLPAGAPAGSLPPPHRP